MPSYIALLTFTEKGAKQIKNSTARAHQFDKLAEKAGVKVVGQYWTMGRFDGLLILSASDETKVLHMLTLLAALGNVRSQTMRAFVDGEFDEIVGR
jgi:uncharacterized protein with GYD domain